MNHSPGQGDIVSKAPTTSEPAQGTRRLSVGQVAKRAGVSVSALHFYERQGLISSSRSAGNQRRYGADTLRRIAVIKAAQRAGQPLSAIQSAFQALPAGHTPTAEDWRTLSMSWRGELDQRIQALIELRDQLDQCIGCGCLTLKQCPLRNPHDVLGHDGPGARRLNSVSQASPSSGRPDSAP